MASSRLRRLKALTPIDAVHVLDGARALTLFSTNDYLGLSSHPEVIERTRASLSRAGHGPRGSALVCGYTTAHEQLETSIADLKGTQAAMLCPSGYAANLAVLAALGSPDVAIFSDALNHASIIDGIGLAKRRGAQAVIYPHLDMEALAQALAQCDRPRKLIVTDAVFSMDGDLAPMQKLVTLKRQHDALLVVDDAHGTLVFGPRGGGLAHHTGTADDVDIHIGTLSKAFGTQGGFVAASRRWVDVLINLGRSFIYSTALPLGTVCGAQAALDVSIGQPEHRQRLWRHVHHLTDALSLPALSPIVPWIVGEEQVALSRSTALLEAGFHITAIRPPTVPEGTSRLRMTLSAAHTTDDIEQLIIAIESCRSVHPDR